MVIAPVVFKFKALKSLKGNWQTALLVSFFQGALLTIASVLSTTMLPSISMETLQNLTQAQIVALAREIPLSTIYLLCGIEVLAFLVTPVLRLGCNHYFVSRLNGEELGFAGLVSKLRLWGKAIWLAVLTGVKIFLWSLLLFVPGVLAAVRYSMATYYLAEEPSLTAWQAIEKSKAAMKNKKMSYYVLMLSFFGWMVLPWLAQGILSGFGPIVALVAYQFAELFVTTYMNGAFAAFFLGVRTPAALDEMTKAVPAMQGRAGWMSQPGSWDGNADRAEEAETNPPKPSEEQERETQEEKEDYLD